MDDLLLDWRTGTQSQFDKIASSRNVCRAVDRYSPALSPWSRQIDLNMSRTYIDPGAAQKNRFLQLSNTDKLGLALQGAFGAVPKELHAKMAELRNPTNLAIMAGALAVWIGSHATPIGWIVDIGMAGLGVVALGSQAIDVMLEVKAFALGVIEAQTETELIQAGQHLGKAIVMVGVDMVIALLLKKAIVKVRQPKALKGDAVEPQKLLFGKYDPKTAQTRLKPDNNAVVQKNPVPVEPFKKTAVPVRRPSWRQSEIDAGKALQGQGYSPQKSFKNGVEVPYGTKGSVRPEFYKPGTSVEVKNYNVETAAGRANLERNVVNQAMQRTEHLPSGTTQSLTIDVRGQNVTRSQLNEMLTNIEQKSGGAIVRENINIIR